MTDVIARSGQEKVWCAALESWSTPYKNASGDEGLHDETASRVSSESGNGFGSCVTASPDLD